MPDNGFGGSLSGASLDADRKKTSLAGAYSDDAVYIGYAKAGTVVPISWNKGGILRLLTYDNPDPANWSVSRVIDDIGPVTSSVTKLQDVTNHKLWLFFGTGRYYVKGDDPSNVNTLFGILEPCYFASSNPTTVDTFQGSVAAPCTTTISATSTATGMTSASASTLVDQSTAITTSGGVLATGKEGWYINLGAASGSSYPKRTITNPVANSTGVVLFTAFTPSTDVCTYGGTTSVWAVKYNTGGVGSTKLKGQILIQLSTGAFQQIDVASAFTENLGRETPQYQGVPPRSEPSITTNANHFPSKRILHIQER
jgi:type IV pilus assembly protein PilY1